MAEYYNSDNPKEQSEYGSVWADPNYQHSDQDPEYIASLGPNPSYKLIPTGSAPVDPNDPSTFKYWYGNPDPAKQQAAADTGPDLTDPAYTLENPEAIITDDMKLANQTPQLNPNEAGTNIDPNAGKYQMDADALKQDAATVDSVDPRDTATYEAEQTYDKVADEDMQAAQGTVSDDALVDPNAGTVDMQGAATGVNEDGTVNWAGEALKEYAEQDLNAVDPKATVKGQLDILQSEFVGPNGEPQIPFWAQSTARSVQKIAAFKGMTGTAATAAMSQAMLEASVQIAEKDAAFYQTLTIKNLDNKQQQTINRAAVLANMELSNADARLTAAVQNAQAFLAMDMKNLDNEQQARAINNQNRVQSILEDAKAVNTQRLFEAESQNQLDMFYDNLNASIQQFNASSINDMAQFNASMENDREKFYKEMQYNIDVANAKWRQTVTLAQAEMDFQAAATDVQNLVGLSVESLNQIWDRSDALLDYAWKSSENELDRIAQLANTELAAEYELAAAEQKGWGQLWGTLAGTVAGKSLFSWMD